MMTCASNPSRIFEIRNAGATEILAKHFAPNALAARIASTLKIKRFFFRTDTFCGSDRRRQRRHFNRQRQAWFDHRNDAGAERSQYLLDLVGVGAAKYPNWLATSFIDSLYRSQNRLFHNPEHLEVLLDGFCKARVSE